MRHLSLWLLALSLLVRSASGQTLTFPEFVLSLEQKMAIPESDYDRHVGLRPVLTDDFRRTIEVLFREDQFVAILISEETTVDRAEQSGTLLTYDREGRSIDRLEYSYSMVGDFYSRTVVCSFTGQTITCTRRTIESTQQEVYDEHGALTGMQPVTVKDERIEETYRLTAEGRFELVVESGLQPSSWVVLTEADGEWVIYHYCFAGLASIELTQAAGGGMVLVVFTGQNSDIYDVQEIRREGDVFALRIKSRYSQSAASEEITLRYLDDAGRIVEWVGLYSVPTRAVLSAFQDEMPAIYERNGDCGEP